MQIAAGESKLKIFLLFAMSFMFVLYREKEREKNINMVACFVLFFSPILSYLLIFRFRNYAYVDEKKNEREIDSFCIYVLITIVFVEFYQRVYKLLTNRITLDPRVYIRVERKRT